MKNKLFDCGIIEHRSISPSYTKFQSSPSVSDGVLSTQHSFVQYSAQEKIKSSEFSLGNLIAIGAFDKLQYVSMSIDNDMNFVDNFSNAYSKIKENHVQETL